MRVFPSLLRQELIQLDETVKIDKTQIDAVVNDPGFRLGWEFEFHIMSADRMLVGDDNDLPDDFYSFRVLPSESSNNPQRVFAMLRPEIARYLGINPLDITIDTDMPGKWRLKTDDSLYSETGNDLYMMYHPRENLGAELVSPPLPLKQGLQALYRFSEMIGDFRNERGVRFQTSSLTGVHINLSHILMEHQPLDYAKVAILLGDEHYLQDFRRTANDYARPLLQGMAAKIARALHQRDNTDHELVYGFRGNNTGHELADLGMFRLKNWNAQKVLADLKQFVPIGHHMAVDFSRLDTDNPYVEFRMAGNIGYEERVDDLVTMVLRFAALLKIGLDPNAYRQEYLSKAYRLITSVVGNPNRPAQESGINEIMNKVRIYLKPIMAGPTREVLKKIHMSALSKQLVKADGAWLLYLIRLAIDAGQLNNNNVRRGLSLLKHEVFDVETRDLQFILRNPRGLLTMGILRQSDFAQKQAHRIETVLDPKTGKPVIDPKTRLPVRRIVPNKEQTPDRSLEIMKALRSTVASL